MRTYKTAHATAILMTTAPPANFAIGKYQLVPREFDHNDHNAIAVEELICGYEHDRIPAGSPVFVSECGVYRNKQCFDDFTERC